jgi:hypothetical protein
MDAVDKRWSFVKKKKLSKIGYLQMPFLEDAHQKTAHLWSNTTGKPGGSQRDTSR